LLKNPVKIIQKVNNAEKMDEYIRLYSISKIEILGPQTAFNQKE
jgi:hypothetical protein